jgi:hypothetical protein
VPDSGATISPLRAQRLTGKVFGIGLLYDFLHAVVSDFGTGIKIL